MEILDERLRTCTQVASYRRKQTNKQTNKTALMKSESRLNRQIKAKTNSVHLPGGSFTSEEDNYGLEQTTF